MNTMNGDFVSVRDRQTGELLGYVERVGTFGDGYRATRLADDNPNAAGTKCFPRLTDAYNYVNC